MEQVIKIHFSFIQIRQAKTNVLWMIYNSMKAKKELRKSELRFTYFKESETLCFLAYK